MTDHSPDRRAGFSLLEMIISLVVLSVIMGSAISILRSQSQSFLKGGARMDLNQNARFALTTVDRTLRTLGAGTAEDQPMLVYADHNTIVFNANYASDSSDGTAVYLNPDLPTNQNNAVTTATPITIPGTAITYPTRNYVWVSGLPSRAETIILAFRPDSSTADPSDYVLMQQVNDGAGELIARTLRPYTGRPFFDFWYDSTGPSGQSFLRQVDNSRLPLRHLAAQHGSQADVGTSALTDSVRMVRVSFVATNGTAILDTASRAFSSTVQLPNNGLQTYRICGNTPSMPAGFSASAAGGGRVTVNWSPSGDDLAGERDVTGYNLSYRLTSQPKWTTWVNQSAGYSGYSLIGGGFTPGQTYVFGITAQDCTPKESGILTFTVTVAP